VGSEQWTVEIASGAKAPDAIFVARRCRENEYTES
jgi:hypothetical protein